MFGGCSGYAGHIEFGASGSGFTVHGSGCCRGYVGLHRDNGAQARCFEDPWFRWVLTYLGSKRTVCTGYIGCIDGYFSFSV